MQRTITEIPIATIFDRECPTEAIVCGKFAVTSQGRKLEIKPGGTNYTITHVATGYALGRCFGLKNAQALAHKLTALLPDWDIQPSDFKEPFSERYKAFIYAAKSLFQEVK